MKLLTYTTLILFLFATQTFAQRDNYVIHENLSHATEIIDDIAWPEGIDIPAAFNDGGDIIIDFTSQETEGVFNLKIYDITGKLVVSNDFTTNNIQNRIRVASPISSKGIYIISLNSQKHKSVKKFYL